MNDTRDEEGGRQREATSQNGAHLGHRLTIEREATVQLLSRNTVDSKMGPLGFVMTDHTEREREREISVKVDGPPQRERCLQYVADNETFGGD